MIEMKTPPFPHHRRVPWLLPGLMLLITLVGFALRAHDLGAKSFWYDELRQIEVSRLPLPDWGATLKAHAARPLDYAITRALLTFTRSEWVLRFPALIWGTLTIPIVYRLGRRLLGRAEGLVGAFLFALSSLGVIFSQELRPYAIYALASAASFWMLDRGLRQGSRAAWLMYAMAIGVGLLTHYFWIMIVIGQVAYVGIAAALRQISARRFLSFVAALAAGGAVLFLSADPEVVLPLGANFVSAFLSQTLANQAPPVSLTAPGLNPFAPTLTYDFFVRRILAQLGAGEGYALMLFNGLLLVGIVGSLAARSRRGIFFLLSWLIVGPGLIIGYLFYRNEIFAMRYVLFVLPPYLLLAARGLVMAANWIERWLPGRRLAPALTAMALIAFAWLDTHYVASYYRTPKDDWRRVGKFLAANVQAGDAIFAPNVQSFIEFYFPGATDHLVYSDSKLDAQRTYGGHERTWFVVSDWVTYDITDTKKVIELFQGVKFQWDKSSFVKFTHRGESEAEMQLEAAAFRIPPPSLPGRDWK